MALTSAFYTNQSSPNPGRRTPGIRGKWGGTRRATKPVEAGFLSNLRIKFTLRHRRQESDATLCPSEPETVCAKQDLVVQLQPPPQEKVSVDQPSDTPLQKPDTLDRSCLRKPQDPSSTTDVTLAAGVADRGQRRYKAFLSAGDGAINTNVSPAEPNRLSRLVQRTKAAHRHSWAAPSAADDCHHYLPLVDEADADGAVLDGAPHNETRPVGSRPSTAVPELARPQLGGAIAADSPKQKPRSRKAAMQALAPQQSLRKKASFRERLSIRLRPSTAQLSPTPPPQEEKRPRSAYVPTHAASDFSRLTVSARRPPRRSYDEARTLAERPGSVSPVAAASVEDQDVDFYVKPKRMSPPLQTLMENESTLADGSSRRESDGGTDDRPQSHRQQERSKRGHHASYKLVADPWEPSEVPSPPRRVNAILQATEQEDESIGLLVPPTNPFADAPKERSASDAGPRTDFEVFIARAEAEDHARREQVMRNRSQRSSAVPPAYTRPSPHHQFASATSGGNAVPPASLSISGSGRQRREGHRDSAYDAAKRASWNPSFAPNDDVASLARRSPPPRGSDSLEKSRVRALQDQQPRSLRRQSSIAQRISDYVRPAREHSRYQEADHRASSRTAMRTSITGR
ncbi:hypothetical protein GQ53DRAFT_753257 [Thozetella sp. PMI_491]|nr:hypothetical protein GQ53DRAFT_753257 [Thozetella sp. PMI_491]